MSGTRENPIDVDDDEIIDHEVIDLISDDGDGMMLENDDDFGGFAGWDPVHENLPAHFYHRMDDRWTTLEEYTNGSGEIFYDIPPSAGAHRMDLSNGWIYTRYMFWPGNIYKECQNTMVFGLDKRIVMHLMESQELRDDMDHWLDEQRVIIGDEEANLDFLMGCLDLLKIELDNEMLNPVFK